MNTKEATVAMVLSGVLRHPDVLPEHALLSGAHAGTEFPDEPRHDDGPLGVPRISLLNWLAGLRTRTTMRGE
jgi:hypothetical protein